MAAESFKVSPTLQTLIDKGLFDRLPPTFSNYFFEQFRSWDTLFPAEQSYFERLFGLLEERPPAEVDAFFAPLRAVEQKMGVNEKLWPKRQFTLEQVDFLNRNPYYPQWRHEVVQIFNVLDPILDAQVERNGHARLAIEVAPADLAMSADQMWLRIENHGTRVPLDIGDNPDEFLPLLLTGAPKAAGKPTLLDQWADSHPRYDAWAVEAATPLTALMKNGSGAVSYSYARLQTYRERLMDEVRKLVSSEQIRGPRELSARLKQLKILANEADIAADPVLAEFARAILLSGNGTLLLNNTFVEWASIQAIRRARPSMMAVGFGIRSKVKPFSSLLIYSDQDKVNPAPSQADVLGSYVDLEIFHQYLWQEFGKHPEYRNSTALLFVGDGVEQMLVIAPPDFPVRPGAKPWKLAGLHSALREWMNL
jgi:hypothetical protein